MPRYERPLTLDQMAGVQDADLDFTDIPEADAEQTAALQIGFELARRVGLIDNTIRKAA